MEAVYSVDSVGWIQTWGCGQTGCYISHTGGSGEVRQVIEYLHLIIMGVTVKL